MVHKIITKLTVLIILVPFGLLKVWSQSTDTLSNLIYIDTFFLKQEPKSLFLNLEPGIQFDAKSKLVFSQVGLDQFLNTHSSIFIKNFGVNSISSLSLRGTAASQSQILWEGVPINSASTGIGDLSLYTTGIFDDIQVKYGSNSTLFGNGNIGGSLLLKSNIADQNAFQAQLAYGSFGNYQGLAKANLNTKIGNFNIKLFGNKSNNNFPYLNAKNQPSLMSNAFKNEVGTIISYSKVAKILNLSYPALIEFHTWLQSTERAVPPALFESISAKVQNDKSWRNVLNITQAIHKKWQVHSKTAFSKEWFMYNDSFAFIHQDYQLQNVYNEIGVSNAQPIKTGKWNHSFIGFLPLQYSSLYNPLQQNRHSINRYGIVVGYQLNHYKDYFQMQTSIRKEWQEGLQVPFIYNLSVASHILQYSNEHFDIQIPVFASFQNSYRIPTLNELYYFPGGNLQLKPEYGINRELGYQINVRNQAENYWQIKLSGSYFNRKVEDWIYWLGVSIWTPYNIAEVYSRGWDYQLKWEKNQGNKKWYLATDYTYTISTTQDSYLPQNNVIGKQIPYTPRYVMRNNAGVQWASFLINLSHSYTGYRFTNLDESAFLPPYQLWGLQARYGFHIKEQILSLQLMINNLLDTSYESVNQRPMPGRNFLLSISYSW